jgi:thiosulfate/3-mercaptopyruvate sulfurtransferase
VSPLLRSFALAVLVAAPLAAQGPRERLLVSPRWLNDHINDPSLVVLHVGEKPAYEQAHIPGARLVELRQIMIRDSATRLSTELPPIDSLRVALTRLGISDNSRIVVSFSGTWLPLATRTILTLDHAGLGDAVSLLDGGVAAWTREGYKTTAEVTPARTGTLASLRTKPVMVAADYVRDNIGKPGIVVIDARAGAFYDGVQEGGPMDAHRKGHIKGAASLPYTDITDENMTLKTPEQLQALFTKAGAKPGDTIIGYCHVGQQATAMLFAARTLGYKFALYDGSFEDWARRDWPVAVPPGK